MTLSQIANIADLITALVVMVSVVFVAIELREGTRQAKRANTQQVIAGIRALKDWGKDPALAEVITRGRQSYDSLDDAEKFCFANFMEESLTAYDSFLLHRDSNLFRKGESERAGIGAFRQFMAHPGAIQWWQSAGMDTRWPSHLVAAVERAIAENGPIGTPR
ncbi:hypothetical protein [Actibacterium sp.]|uniref:hypothetical protein n=1 Tax=Actibacterium sp. TaxID=1872125 RepID=UPI003563FBCC